MQELFLEVVNNACQSMVLSVCSLKLISQLSFDGVGCKTRVKFVIGHWSFLIHLLLVRLEVHLPVLFFFDKSFVRCRYLLTPVKWCLL